MSRVASRAAVVPVEARRAFSRLVRSGKMTASGLKQAVARLEMHKASWVEVLLSDRVREIAETLPEQYGLKTLDSFPLAAALLWCKEPPARAALRLL